MQVFIQRVMPVEGIVGSAKPLYVSVAFPLVVAVYLFAGALLVGLTSYITEDKDREWWARAGGIFLSVALAWVVVATVVLYSQWIIEQLSWKLSSGLGMLSGWVTARLGSSSDTVAGRRQDARAPRATTTSGTVKELASRLALPIFLFMLVLTLARANTALLSAIPWEPAVLWLAIISWRLVWGHRISSTSTAFPSMRCTSCDSCAPISAPRIRIERRGRTDSRDSTNRTTSRCASSARRSRCTSSTWR
jgi:hypothetical protein